MTALRLVLILLFASSASQVSSQTVESRLDSLINQIPNTTRGNLPILCDKIFGELRSFPEAKRIMEARRIIDFADSALRDKDEQHQLTAYYCKMALQENILSQHQEGLKSALDGAELAEKLHDDLMLSWFQAQAMHINYGIGNYQEAIRLGKQAIDSYFKCEQKDSSSLDVVSFMSLHNIVGSGYYMTGEYDSAFSVLGRGVRIAQKADHKFWTALLRSSIGEVYRKQKKYKPALELFLEDYVVAKKFKDWKMVCIDVLRIGEMYIKLNDLSWGEHYLVDSLNHYLAKDPDQKEFLNLRRLQILANLEQAKGNLKAALNLQQQYTEAYTASVKKRQAEMVTSTQASYDYARNQREIEALTYRNQIQQKDIRFQRVLFAAVAIVLVLVAVLAIYFIYNYKRQRKVTSLITAQRDEIENKNTELEAQSSILHENNKFIAQQKEEIEAQNESLNKALTDLQNAQDQLILTEKMALLGRLTSGVAHEINTPLGAIKASAENVHMALANVLKKAKDASTYIPQEQASLFFELINQPDLDVKLDFRNRRALKKTFISELNIMGVKNPEAVAEAMINLGIIDNYQRLEPLLKLPRAGDIFRLMDDVSSIKNQNANVRTAVSKASKILFALKSYSYKSQQEKVIPVDLVENVETVLSIYANNLRSIDLVRHFEKVHLIKGYPDALNQVWTNLIYNSIQAMGGTGRLDISIVNCEHNNETKVEIADTGAGISPESKKKIFEPFFTTKGAGEGTGLGLSIVKKILDEHGARIEFESELNKGTVFRVFFHNDDNGT